MYSKKVLLFVFLCALIESTTAQVSARMFRYPDVSKTHITFSYGGDIWIVPIEGGLASKLSSLRVLKSHRSFLLTEAKLPLAATTMAILTFMSFLP